MVSISKHAHTRYIERFGGVNSLKSVTKRENTIRKVVAFGVEIKPNYKLMKLLNNRCKKAKYHLYRNIIAVVTDDVVVTVYKYISDTWEPLKMTVDN